MRRGCCPPSPGRIERRLHIRAKPFEIPRGPTLNVKLLIRLMALTHLKSGAFRLLLDRLCARLVDDTRRYEFLGFFGASLPDIISMTSDRRNPQTRLSLLWRQGRARCIGDTVGRCAHFRRRSVSDPEKTGLLAARPVISVIDGWLADNMCGSGWNTGYRYPRNRGRSIRQASNRRGKQVDRCFPTAV